MLLDIALERPLAANQWRGAVIRLGIAWAFLFALTAAEWREMAHQWWDIDTYNHILLVPAILAWLVWLRRDEIAKINARAWYPGIGVMAVALVGWLGARMAGINLFAEVGALLAFEAAALALLGLRTALVLAFPLAYAAFLVPFGDELIPALQHVTARMTIALTHLSGVPAVIDGLYIDTPAGRFVVAEECSGVKFLVAMTALSVLVAWTRMAGWRRRIVLIGAAAAVSILANGVRAWGTIYVAQWVGAERAGGFDHIVYGWVFFGVVIALVLGTAWRFFEREPGEAGLSAAEAATHPLARMELHSIGGNEALVAIAVLAIGFAVLAALV